MNTIGMKVTLRGDNMYEFLDRLTNIVLPRVRDFHGVGTKFDPELHEAVGKIAVPGAPADSVAGEERPGYLWNGKLLRPARVFVAAEQLPDDVH